MAEFFTDSPSHLVWRMPKTVVYFEKHGGWHKNNRVLNPQHMNSGGLTKFSLLFATFAVF